MEETIFLIEKFDIGKFSLKSIEDILYHAAALLDRRDGKKIFGHKCKINDDDINYVISKIKEEKKAKIQNELE